MQTPNLKQHPLPIKPYSAKELASLYGVGKKTLIRWMEPFGAEVGTRIGRFYTVMQVRIIFERLGLPGNYED